MQFAIKIGNEYLDLLPGTSFDIEQLNPFLQFSNEIEGEHVLPFGAPATAKNNRLLLNMAVHEVKKEEGNINAVVMVHGLQYCAGFIRFEEAELNAGSPLKGMFSLYFVFALASFWTLAKDKTLQDVEYNEPDVTWPFINDWIQSFANLKNIIKNIMINQNRINSNYVFSPFVNQSEVVDSGDTKTMAGNYQTYNSIVCRTGPGDELINSIYPQTGISGSFFITDDEDLFLSRFTPTPYISFLVPKIFSQFGWKIQGAPLLENDYLNETLLHINFIEIFTAFKEDSKSITWQFKKQMPKLKITDFILGLQNKFGWIFDFDYNNNICTVYYRTDIIDNRTRLNFTGKSSPYYVVRYDKEANVYSLKSRQSNPPINFKEYTDKGALMYFYQMPQPSKDNLGWMYFIQTENSFYACHRLDKDGFSFEKITDGTYDYIPYGSDKEIVSNACAAGSMRMQGRTIGDRLVPVWFIWPYINQTDIDNEYFYLAYYHGLTPVLNNTTSDYLEYPYLSAQPYTNTGFRLRNYSLNWLEKDFVTKAEQGLYLRRWKRFLDLVNKKESVTISIRLNMADVFAFNYRNTLIIQNNEYLIVNPKISLPLPPQIEMELLRL
jgi:hypothetical protein